jgi:spore cortex formation protein SpoVR/YcgB (stage V sporulation)
MSHTHYSYLGFFTMYKHWYFQKRRAEHIKTRLKGTQMFSRGLAIPCPILTILIWYFSQCINIGISKSEVRNRAKQRLKRYTIFFTRSSDSMSHTHYSYLGFFTMYKHWYFQNRRAEQGITTTTKKLHKLTSVSIMLGKKYACK